MERMRTWVRPEIVITVTGLVIISLVALEIFMIQTAFDPAVLVSAGRDPNVLQQLLEDRALLLNYAGVRILLVLAIFVGLALMLMRQRRKDEQLNAALERKIEERTTELHAQEVQYRRIVETAHEGILMVGADNTVTYVNPRSTEILGYTPQELIGTSIVNLIPPEEKPAAATGLEAVSSLDAGSGEYGIRRKSGEDVWLLWSSVPYRDETDQYAGSLFLFTDITENKRAQDALQANERLFRSLVEVMPLCVFRKDREGRITFGNTRFWNAIGLDEQAGLGKTDYEYSPRELADKYRQDDLTVMETGETIEVVEDFQPPSGSLQIVRVSKSPVRDHRGDIQGVQVMFWDITEGRRQGEQLREREELLSRILNTVEDGIYIIDRAGRFTFANKATERILGATHQEIFESCFDDARWRITTLDGAPFPNPDQPFTRVIGKGEPVYDVQQIIHRPDGSHAIVSINAAPLHDAQGAIVGEVASVTDITARKQAEGALRLQNEYLTALHDTTINLVGHLELNDLLHTITQRAATLVGTTNGYIYVHEPGQDKMTLSVGTGIFEQMVGSKTQKGIGATGTVWATGEPLVIDDYQKWQGQLAKPGSHLVHSLVCVPLKSNGQVVGVFGLAHTEIDKKFDDAAVNGLTRFAQLAAIALDNARLYDAAQQEIRERKLAEEKFRSLFDASPDAIVVLDPNQYGWPIVDCNPVTCEMNGYTRAELIGQSIDILNLAPSTPEDRARYLAQVRREGVSRVEAEHRHKDGHVFAIESSTCVIRVGDSEMVMGIDRDITKRREVDRMKTEFISTVSHELRTPLTSIRGSLGLIAGGVAGEIPARAKSMVDIAYKNSERLVRLINDILDVEKIESGKMEFQLKPMELAPLIEQAIEANRAYGEQYQVRFVLQPVLGDLKINADADRMTQVLTNLLSNAAKFSPPQGDVEIRAERVGEVIRVSVQDHGNGIPEEFKTRIFQKFAQADSSDTRQKGGTGLGLSIVKAIVEKHGGTIGFDTVAGQGTTFYFELPPCQEMAAPMDVSQSSARPRILILEDDHDVALLLRMMLTQGGFEADVAYDRKQASVLLKERKYAVLTLDLLLPDEEGLDFVRELRSQPETHDLPIVVVSAKAEQGALQLNGDAVWVADWLQKPIDQQKLLQAVQHAAGGAPERRARILHVEDDTDVLSVVQAILQEMADVIPAETVKQAHTLLEHTTFDLIILDAVLPDGSGLDLLYSLRRDGNQVPVVIFSASENDTKFLSQVNAALVKTRTSNEQLLLTIGQLIHAPNGGTR